MGNSTAMFRTLRRLGVGVVAVSLLGCLAYRVANAGGQSPAAFQGDVPRDLAAGRTPVLVELFTSEGCSSCPSADELLARLEREQPIEGAQIVALAFHVDYWDSLGWPDPFASPAWTGRQQVYGRAFGKSGVYTPQAIVDGTDEFVGSNEGQTRRAVTAAVHATKARVTLKPGAKSNDPAEVSIEVEVGALPAGTPESDVFIAVTEGTVKVDVPRGENGGRTLSHSSVVKTLKTIGPADPKGSTTTTTVRIPSGAKSPRAVVFVQTRTTRKVLGVGLIPLAPKP